ncbi:MAG: DUF1028 domain-containing protein [Hyphomicrobiaceae bacterium]|nr:MAG: DUF1028 domain-containing protein [Hyphomicrobiaceae bacterium]
MTFSIAARCARTGMFAISVSSSSPAVAARCAHARAGAGVLATQNITDPRLGPMGLDRLAAGRSAEEALADILRDYAYAPFRQVTVIDGKGRTASYSGARTLGVHAVAAGDNAIAAGNLLASQQVPQAMIGEWLKNPEAHIGDRVLDAMRAGLSAGGEAGPIHSAGMLIVDRVPWPVADLRVDWHESDPIGTLCDLWRRWRPEMEAYVTRALSPDAAPAFGVAGET